MVSICPFVNRKEILLMIALDFNIIYLPIRWESLIFNRLKILVKTGQGFFNLLNLQSRGSPISSIWTTNLSNSPCSKWWNVLISFFGYVWLWVVFYFHGLCCIVYVFCHIRREKLSFLHQWTECECPRQFQLLQYQPSCKNMLI